MERRSPRYLFAGKLTRDYIVFPSGEPLIDVLGGNVLYAALGAVIWEPDPPPAIIARVGEDYPHEWLERFKQLGINPQGINIIPEAVDLRSFVAILDSVTRANDEPVAHFARLGRPFPKALLGYHPPSFTTMDSRTRMQPTSLRSNDIPTEFLGAGVIHLCPMDYLTQSLLPAYFRQNQFTTVTLDPSVGYMNPTYWNDVSAILIGLTAFLPSEDGLRSLFQGKSDDLWEMAAALSDFQCEIIVINRGERGQLVYDAASKNKWEVPPYPARAINPIYARDAFCGGFLAGYRRSFDPLEATLFGNISASIVVEGQMADFALEVLPGLPEARLESLRNSVRKV